MAKIGSLKNNVYWRVMHCICNYGEKMTPADLGDPRCGLSVCKHSGDYQGPVGTSSADGRGPQVWDY